ncbi:MAG: class B sortase [Oscillospiraceae bacterium]|nr:class B sortase [Oscillospiraceae bacterium]
MSENKPQVRKIKLKAKKAVPDNNKSGEKGKKLEQREITIQIPNEKRIDNKETENTVNEIYDDEKTPHYVFKSSEKFSKDKVIKTKKQKKKSILSILFPSKGDSAGEIIRKIIFIISFAVMVVCLAFVIQYLVENYQNEKRNTYLETVYRSSLSVSNPSSRLDSNISAENENYYTLIAGASKLLEINQDVAGYISIPDTGIDYPLMQGKNDNDEYLKTDIYGNNLRAGSIFLDYRNVFDEVENGIPVKENSDCLVIYGHNMRDESMFGKLKYYKTDENYYSKHPVIELNSNYRQYKYKIFGIFISDPDDNTDTFFDYWNTLDFQDKEQYFDFINEIKRRTIVNTNVDMEYGDKILLLSTCNNAVKDGRLVVAARLVRDGEDEFAGTENSSVNENAKMPSSYYGSKKNTYDESKFVPYEEK